MSRSRRLVTAGLVASAAIAMAGCGSAPSTVGSGPLLGHWQVVLERDGSRASARATSVGLSDLAIGVPYVYWDTRSSQSLPLPGTYGTTVLMSVVVTPKSDVNARGVQLVCPYQNTGIVWAEAPGWDGTPSRSSLTPIDPDLADATAVTSGLLTAHDTDAAQPIFAQVAELRDGDGLSTDYSVLGWHSDETGLVKTMTWRFGDGDAGEPMPAYSVSGTSMRDAEVGMAWALGVGARDVTRIVIGGDIVGTK